MRRGITMSHDNESSENVEPEEEKQANGGKTTRRNSLKLGASVAATVPVWGGANGFRGWK